MVAFQNTEHALQSLYLGYSAPSSVAEPAASVTLESISLDDAIGSYLEEIRRFRSAKTIAACHHMLTLFGSRLPVRSAQVGGLADATDNGNVFQRRAHNDLRTLCSAKPSPQTQLICTVNATVALYCRSTVDKVREISYIERSGG